ncbi:hypothetical protein F8388_020713 [Cannabis sativa]|uniref:CCHC-type domain-containing protein n=1 Tax=Cannabis sativa TaxID=3483 RepID=A0A7J6G5G3_CANSA|nr:hypothetical protein F8388_020713 [Cannabis sativa]
MNFDFTSFLISINNVPLACMTELFAREWGEQIGKLGDIKIVNGTMKVRVQINITEPLKWGLRVVVDEQGTEVSLIFQYEHLPDFCFDCGIIGHKSLDCPLRDFAGDNPNFDRGRFCSWMCAPGSPPRDRFRSNKKRDDYPNNRPIMTMGEASRIVSAVERNRIRYSGPPLEELAPTSVLEARELDEESNVEATGARHSIVVSAPVVKSAGSNEGDKVKSELFPSPGSMVAEVSVLPDAKKGKVVVVDMSSTGVEKVSTSLNMDMYDEAELNDHSKQRLNKAKKGKGIMVHSSRDELYFRQALQQTFEPLIKAQKSKTWKRLNSSNGRGSKVTNAKNKLSPKAGGGGKRKMDIEKGGADCSMSAMNEFQQALDKCSLVDLGFEGQCFTWLNKRHGGAHVQERLDHYFCNQGRHDLFPSVKLGAWNKSKFGSIPRLVRETQKQVDDLLSVSAPLVVFVQLILLKGCLELFCLNF